MSELSSRPEVDCEVLPLVAFDRRKQPRRRADWRGGRRDTDWINRPMDSLARLQRQRTPTPWQRLAGVSAR